MATATREHLLVRVDSPAARITLNRPEKRNALSLALMEELIAALEEVGTDPEARAIVIEGAGPVFSAGHDLGEMVGRDAGFYEQLFDVCTVMMETIHRLPQPVIAKVHGIATAAGCQLVAACDLALAATGTRFATPGVRIGLFCSTPMVPLSRAVGRKRALQLLLTGEPIDATTACEWGLINGVVPGEELEGASYVGTTYGLPNRSLGAVGLLGPLRMDYEKAIRSVRAAAYELSRLVEDVYGAS